MKQLLILLLLFTSLTALAAPDNQAALKAINHKISKLKKKQRLAHNKKQELVDELRAFDIKLSKAHQKIQSTETNIEKKKQNLLTLQTQLAPLAKEFNKQKLLLSQHLVLHYHLGQAQPLALLLNQRDPNMTDRLLSYIAHINKVRLEKMQTVKALKQQIEQKHQLEQQNLTELSQLTENYKATIEQYQKDKALQHDIIHTLNQQIRGRNKKISQLTENKRQLETILAGIARKHYQQLAQIPFQSLKHKLPWPAKGKLYLKPQSNQDNELPFNGIYIRAPEGRQVSAIHAGKVVFADWLRGYGLLIIVQHDHGFMTLYANNQALYKEKGDKVITGDKIATIGHSGGQLENGLYFELRKHGKPLAPLSWLKST